MPQTQATTTTSHKALPTGEQIYDAIMIQIEPDLLTKNIPLLDEKYKAESPVQRTERMARYQKAMTEYDKRYTELMTELNQDVAAQKRAGIAAIENKSTQKESVELNNIESAILSS